MIMRIIPPPFQTVQSHTAGIVDFNDNIKQAVAELCQAQYS